MVYRLAPSPTTTKGAQKAGCAQWGWLSLAASLNMERRRASERPIVGLVFRASNMPRVSSVADWLSTGQCETSRARLPA